MRIFFYYPRIETRRILVDMSGDLILTRNDTMLHIDENIRDMDFRYILAVRVVGSLRNKLRATKIALDFIWGQDR